MDGAGAGVTRPERGPAAANLREPLAVRVGLTLVAIGYLLAYRLYVAGPREMKIVLFCLMFPLWTSVLIRAFAWVALLQNNGIVNAALLGLGAVDRPLPMVRNA